MSKPPFSKEPEAVVKPWVNKVVISIRVSRP